MRTFNKLRQVKLHPFMLLSVLLLIFFSACSSKAERFLNKGITQVEKGKYDKGAHFFTESILCDSLFAEAYYHRALVRKKMNCYTEALADLNKVLELDTLFQQAYATRGEIKGILHDYYGSLDDYKKGLALYTKYGLQNTTDLDFFPKDSNDIVQIQKQYSKAILQSGLQKYSSSDYVSAVSDFSMAILLGPENIEAYYLSGNAQFLLYDFEGAIANYSEVIALQPEQSDAYFARGYAKEKLGQTISASKDYSIAKALDKR